VKILLDEKNDRILGAHMVGHEASELINYFAMAIRLGLPTSEMRKTVWTYPTSSYYIKYMI
jgi:glutathione reductase (NADPH)